MLVTGAGGSIGSELCRQIARVGPDASSSSSTTASPGLFEIERELVDEREFHATAAVLADAGNATKMRQVFEKYRPAVVFHAAAYKHVPLMEANPLEAVRNNSLVTRTVADIAVEFGAKRFVLVSTDKAVNAKTVMGQSKALCEWIVEAWGHRDDIDDAVLRRALRQRARVVGQRHPDLPQADRPRRPRDRHAPGDDPLLHDDPRGRPARHPGGRDRRPRPGLRARHGRAGEDRRPRRDDDPALGQGARRGRRTIEFVGARPGEKLHEELWSETENVTPSAHEAIMLVTRPPIDRHWLEDELDELVAPRRRRARRSSWSARLNRSSPLRAGTAGLESEAGAAEATPASESV